MKCGQHQISSHSTFLLHHKMAPTAERRHLAFGKGEMYILYFDGMFRSLHPWPQRSGLMGYGWAIFRRESIAAHGFGMFAWKKNATSCVSEYLALIEGLEALVDLHIGNMPVEIRGDAKSVICQMQGVTSVNSAVICNLQHRALKLTKHFADLTWVWIPRRENHYADILSRQGIMYTGIVPGHLHPVLSGAQSKLYVSGSLVPLMDLRVYTPRQINR